MYYMFYVYYMYVHLHSLYIHVLFLFSLITSVQTVLGSRSHGEPRPRPLRSDVIERLQQLEEQLNAIESTAKTVEGEFKTTNKVTDYTVCPSNCMYMYIYM